MELGLGLGRGGVTVKGGVRGYGLVRARGGIGVRAQWRPSASRHDASAASLNASAVALSASSSCTSLTLDARGTNGD